MMLDYSITGDVLVSKRAEAAPDRLDACAILLDIQEQSGGEGKVAAFGREVTDSGPPAWPAVLGSASEFLEKICEGLLISGRGLRLDVPADQVAVEAPDVLLWNSTEVREFLSLLRHARTTGRLYPIHIWGVESHAARDSMKTLDAFSVVRIGNGLAQRILDAGTVRVEVLPASITLWFKCSLLEEMRQLVETSSKNVGAHLRWVQ